MRTRFLRGFALSLLLGTGVVVAADVAPSHAACKPTDPSATCLTFDPLTESNIVDRGGFTGQLTPPPGPDGFYSKVRIQFKFTGAWLTPFVLDQLSLKGDGITSSLSFPAKTINFATTEYDDNRTAWVDLDTNITSLNFKDSLMSLTIPAGVAPDGATLEARIQYSSPLESNLNSSGNNLKTTAKITPPPSDVPGPLPILGAGIGLAYSRRLRSRVSATV